MILSGFRGSTSSLGRARANHFDISLQDELENFFINREDVKAKTHGRFKRCKDRKNN